MIKAFIAALIAFGICFLIGYSFEVPLENNLRGSGAMAFFVFIMVIGLPQDPKTPIDYDPA